jgi:hypothetical protein
MSIKEVTIDSMPLHGGNNAAPKSDTSSDEEVSVESDTESSVSSVEGTADAKGGAESSTDSLDSDPDSDSDADTIAAGGTASLRSHTLTDMRGETDADSIADTDDFLASDPLYFILSKFLMTKDGRNIATVLADLCDKLHPQQPKTQV